MSTQILKINPQKPEQEKIKQAVQVLKNGGIIIFPTDTIYGIGCSIFKNAAVSKIFKLKKRVSTKPLSINIAEKKEIYNLVKEVSKNAEKLMKKFWPGALTLVFKKINSISKIVSGGKDTIAIRIPNNKIVLNLIKEAGFPIVSTSANLSGESDPHSFSSIVSDFYGKVDLIIDVGDVCGIPSTVLDVSSEFPRLLREGSITKRDIEKVLNKEIL